MTKKEIIKNSGKRVVINNAYGTRGTIPTFLYKAQADAFLSSPLEAADIHVDGEILSKPRSFPLDSISLEEE